MKATGKPASIPGPGPSGSGIAAFHPGETSVTVSAGGKSTKHSVNQREKTEKDTISLGEITLRSAGNVIVKFDTEGANGNVHIDAVALRKVK